MPDMYPPPSPQKRLSSSLLHNTAHWSHSCSNDPATPTPLDVLFDMSIPEPAWIIPGLLPMGVTLLAGPPEIGKTAFSLALALAVAQGLPALEHFPTIAGAVLFLGLEDSKRSMCERTHRLLRRQPAPHLLEWVGSWNMLRAGGLADLEEWLETHEMARLVVIDTLARVHPHNKYSRRERVEDDFMMPLKAMAQQYHVALLLHQHRDIGEAIDSVRVQIGMLDCLMQLRQDCGQATTILSISGHNIKKRGFPLKIDSQTISRIIEGV